MDRIFEFGKAICYSGYRDGQSPTTKCPTKEQIEEIVKTYPTPFHIYDEKGLRKKLKDVKDAFSWNKGFKEYFAVKANPNPFLINIMKEYGCGADCSSMAELMLAKELNFDGSSIMFSSNDTPRE